MPPQAPPPVDHQDHHEGMPSEVSARREPRDRRLSCTAIVRLALATSLLVALAAPARAQGVDACETPTELVRSVRFLGNHAFDDDELASRIVTTPMSWASRVPLLNLVTDKRCLDWRQFAGDVLRLQYFYRTHGYPQAKVDTSVARDGRDVSIRFLISEGAAIVVDTLVVSGLEGVPGGAALRSDLPVKLGGAFDEYAISASRDTIVRRLRNAGYPRADVLRNYSVDRERKASTVELTVLPGPRTHVGEVAVELEALGSGAPRMSPEAVRAILGVGRGDLYVERDLVAGQRRLYATEAFRQVRIELDSSALGSRDTLARIVVYAQEAERYQVSAGLGWGTIDCFRTQGTLTDYDFLGGARRLTLTGRVSKLGVGNPAAFGDATKKAICPDASSDAYGNAVNYYIGASFRQPVLFGLRTVPVVTVYSERRSEYNAYRRTTPIGLSIAVSPVILWNVPLSFGYSLEFGQDTASAAFFCVVNQLCEAADRDNAQRLQRVAVFSATATREFTDNPVNPTRGVTMRLELRHASPTIGSETSIRFNKVIAELSAFTHVVLAGTLAVRFRVGAVFDTRGFELGTGGQFVPIQERLFAGGPNTVRGYRPNELGPAVYRALSYKVQGTAPDTSFVATPGDAPEFVVPVGGNTMIVGNIEYRVRSPVFGRILQLSVFTDVGRVWNRSGSTLALQTSDLRWTPGFGLRILTAFGAFRFDMGYNGYQRDAGPAYYDAPLATTSGLVAGALYCVSPGNLDHGRPAGTTGTSTCPGTYRPPAPGDFWSRLTPSISIGQAF